MVVTEQCPWSMRPSPNLPQVDCEKPPHVPDDEHHEGVWRDVAYEGSRTELGWLAGDRREFTGPWPGYCRKPQSSGYDCTLPAGHPRLCAV